MINENIKHFRKTRGMSQEEMAVKLNVVRQTDFKMGKGCFPNKKILRNSPCLPACKQKNIATRLRDTT